MPVFSTKAAVIRACGRVHHLLTKVGDDLQSMAASSLLQARFDMEVLGAMGATIWWLSQLSSIRKQRSDQMFKSSRQKRSQTTPNPSRVLILGKLSMSFAVRNVTELIVHDGQQADESRKTKVERCRWVDSEYEISR